MPCSSLYLEHARIPTAPDIESLLLAFELKVRFKLCAIELIVSWNFGLNRYYTSKD